MKWDINNHQINLNLNLNLNLVKFTFDMMVHDD